MLQLYEIERQIKRERQRGGENKRQRFTNRGQIMVIYIFHVGLVGREREGEKETERVK